MAKVLNPLNSSEARGRVGGLVYNTWRGIRTVKTHTDPGHQTDPLRQAHKAIVQAAGQRWRTITDLQRAAWNDFADQHPDIDWTGKPLRLAGFHWYVRINTRLADMGRIPWDDPPDQPCRCPTLQPWVIIEPGAAELYWTVDPSIEYLDYIVWIWRAGPHSAGRHPTLHDARQLYRPPYPDGYFGDWEIQVGWHTWWLRPAYMNGMYGPWESVRAYWTS